MANPKPYCMVLEKYSILVVDALNEKMIHSLPLETPNPIFGCILPTLEKFILVANNEYIDIYTPHKKHKRLYTCNTMLDDNLTSDFIIAVSITWTTLLIGHRSGKIVIMPLSMDNVAGDGLLSSRIIKINNGSITALLEAATDKAEYCFSADSNGMIYAFKFYDEEDDIGYEGHDSTITALATDFNEYLFSSSNNCIKFWDIVTGIEKYSIKITPPVNLLCYNSYKNHLYAANITGIINIFNVNVRKIIARLYPTNDKVVSMCLSADEKYLFVGTLDALIIYSTEDYKFESATMLAAPLRSLSLYTFPPNDFITKNN